MTKSTAGVIHGRMIELAEDLGIADGVAVRVQVETTPPSQPWGEGIKQSAGAWASYPELDSIMQRVHAERKLKRGARSEP